MANASNPCVPFWLNPLCRIQLCWTLLIILLSSGVFLLSPLDRNYTSGELLDQLNAFILGDFFNPLQEAPYRVFNYPPLFHGLVSILHQTGLSLLAAGRWLNLMAFWGCGVLIYRWLRKENISRFYTLIALGLVGTCYPLLTSLGQIQLQMTAVFFSLSGFYFLSFCKHHRDIIFAGILLTLACFTKQTQLLPAWTALLWCFFYLRKYFLSLLLVFLFTNFLGLGLLQWIYGSQAWVHLLHYTVGTFSWANLGKQVLGHVAPWIIFFILALDQGIREKKKRGSLIWWYFISSTAGLITSARLGSSAMYFVEWSWTLIIWLGLALPQFFEGKSKILKTLILLQIILADLGLAIVLAYDAKQVRDQTKVMKISCPQLSDKTQLIVSSHPGLIQACGHHLAFYPFILSSLMEQKLWDGAPLLKDLEARKFTALLLEFSLDQVLNSTDQERWNAKLLQVLAAHYQLAESQDGFFLYLPKN